MTRLEFDGWALECDVDATRRAYEQIAVMPRQVCDCLYCRNFEAARSVAIPDEALALYAQLGISPELEVETYELGPPRGGPGREYGGWHHFVGTVEVDPGRSTKLTPEFEIWFREGRDLASSAFAGLPLVQVEFHATVPWVLDEAPDGEAGQEPR
jgi:hypothetical protein